MYRSGMYSTTTHTAFKGGTTQKLDRYEYLYISCHIVVGVRKASQLEFIYTTDVTEYVQTEVMTSAGITQNAVSHMRKEC